MRLTQLRQADLNLLVVFAVLAEERNASRAAKRLSLSQPAVSRALARLRDTFRDDLLVRTPAGYAPTPKGSRLIQELSVLLPRLDRLLSGERFDPLREQATFRVGATEHASEVLGPLLCPRLSPGIQVSLEFLPWHDGMVDALERGGVDLLLYGDDGTLPCHLAREPLYETEFVLRATAVGGRHRAPPRSPHPESSLSGPSC